MNTDTIFSLLRKVSNKEVRGPSFSVSVPDVHYIRYCEGDKVKVVEIEGGASKDGGVNWLIYWKEFKSWEPPHQSAPLTEDQRQEILANISKSLTLLEMPHSFS